METLFTLIVLVVGLVIFSFLYACMYVVAVTPASELWEITIGFFFVVGEGLHNLYSKIANRIKNARSV